MAPLGIVVLALFSAAPVFLAHISGFAPKKKAGAEPCSACGAWLGARRARCGPLRGRSSYPKCRYTRELDPR